MPQIMCPNCGTTINLEKRREIDFSLIKDATVKHPKTFTELLHITKLSRKTLNLRLKKLCEDGVLVKEEGVYKLNGTSEFANNGRNLAKGFSRVFNDRRMKTGLMLIALLTSMSVSGYVLAMFLIPPQQEELPPQKPVIIGNFTMALDVSEVKDLYGWEATITFNSSELEVLKVTPGGFVGATSVSEVDLNATDISGGIFMCPMDIKEGMLLLGGCLTGNVSGKDGSGRLATIVFEYFVDDYKEPTLVFNERFFRTCLLDPKGFYIPIENSTLTLYTLGK